MKPLSIRSIVMMLILVFGSLCLHTQGSFFAVFAEEKLSEPFDSLKYEEAVAEVTSSWLPESMILVWDIGYTAYAHRQNHLLNPEKALFLFDDQKAVTALDLEWNPTLSHSLTLRTREAVEYSTTDSDSEIKVTLLEGYFQWKNRSRDLTVDIGKIKLEWGSGYAWKPTQVLFQHDSNLVTDKKNAEGIEMVQVEFIIKNMTNTLLFAGLADENGSEDGRLWQSAYRISLERQPWALSLLYHKTSEMVTTTGLSFTGLLSDAMEIHGEWATTDQRDRLTIVKASDGIQTGSVYLPARFNYQDDTSGRNFEKVLVGAQYTFTNDMNLIMELYRTTHGYNDSEWQRIKTGIDEALKDKAWKNELFASTAGNPYSGFLQQTMGLNKIASLRQTYLFIRWTTGESEDLWKWEQIFQLGLDDHSQMSIGKLHKSWSNSTRTEFSCYFFRGEPDSEQGLNPFTEICSMSLMMGF